MSGIMNPRFAAQALGIEKDLTPEQIVSKADWNSQEKLDRLEEMKVAAVGDNASAGAMDLQAIEAAIEFVKADLDERSTNDTVRQI